MGFLIVRPFSVTDDQFDSSNVTEDDYPEYDANRVYALGERSIIAAEHNVYESLIESFTSAVTISIASPGVITWNAHGLLANAPIRFSTTGALPTGIVADTTYFVLAPAANTFNISATPGGAAINTSGGQSGVHTALSSSNYNLDPSLDPQWPNGTPVNWILVSKTNRWKMFDDRNSSQTSNADSIQVALTFTQRPNALSVLNADCASIRVVQRDTMANIVYDQTQPMIESSGTPSHYGWLFQQIQKKTDALFENLIPISGGTIEIILANEGGTVKCGTCLVGYAEDFGGAQYGASVGIQDFSVKQQSEFGDFRILERAFNRTGQFSVFVKNSVIDRLQNLLASRRATPTLYVGTTLYKCTYIYGFYNDMDNVIAYPTSSLLNIDITGLT